MINIKIFKSDRLILETACPVGTPLATILRDNNIYVPMPCGGSGACKKCKVELVREGESTEYVLACQYVLEDNCIIVMGNRDKEHKVETRFLAEEKEMVYSVGDYAPSVKNGIAIDIGTTTIAMQLVEYGNNGAYKILDTYTATNPQRAYGSDVISRIEHANTGKLKILSAQIRSALTTGINKLLSKSDKSAEAIVIAGNATMIYLLMGESCETLGKYPFTAPLIDNVINIEATKLFPKIIGTEQISVTIIPGVSAFVGGDIVAGLFATAAVTTTATEKENTLFVDLGTNGEMALITGDNIFCTSAAAGPALEGGNISCGTGSVPGAIAHVDFKKGVDSPNIEVVKDSEGNSPEPVGLCGSGLIEAVAALRESGVLEDSGLLKEPYFTEGVALYKGVDLNDIVLTQNDIRELQLAKSAVRAGLEILLRHSGLNYRDIDSLYLAGGFGTALSKEAAAKIGLLPKELLERTKAVGNSALAGALRVLVDKEEALWKISGIKVKCVDIPLAMKENFNEIFVSNMNF